MILLVERRALKRQSECSEEKAAKKQKYDEEVEELKKHLQIVPNDDDDDVYTEATPLSLKVPIVDYEIHIENNKPHYKIIRADGTHQLFLSFLSLLRNFDREDLEISSLEKSKRRSWFSKSQNPDIVRVLWSAYHNIHYYTNDLASREKVSFDKTYCCWCKLMLLDNAADSRLQGFTLRDHYCWLKTYCCWCKLMLLDNAADSRLRLLEQSAAVDEKIKKYN
nr:hypothetical protein [Tanacetum cinerariifolium]